MRIGYLEIVTEEVDANCATLERMLGVEFGDPAPELGNARTARTTDGTLVGIRAPMHEAETPVVRPYWRADDAAGALEVAAGNGGEVAHPAMEIPGHCTFGIFFQGGIQHGLWQD